MTLTAMMRQIEMNRRIRLQAAAKNAVPCSEESRPREEPQGQKLLKPILGPRKRLGLIARFPNASRYRQVQVARPKHKRNRVLITLSDREYGRDPWDREGEL